jgi:hypothetical protein
MVISLYSAGLFSILVINLSLSKISKSRPMMLHLLGTADADGGRAIVLPLVRASRYVRSIVTASRCAATAQKTKYLHLETRSSEPTVRALPSI